jgi:hypothetical protein
VTSRPGALEISRWVLAQRNNTATLLTRKNDALTPSQQKQEAQEFYFGLLADVRRFKDVFRNHVMHTRKSYGQKAADDVLDHVRHFMQLASTRISE